MIHVPSVASVHNIAARPSIAEVDRGAAPEPILTDAVVDLRRLAARVAAAPLAGLSMPASAETSACPWHIERPDGLTGGDILTLERLSRVVRSSSRVLEIADLRRCPESSLLSRGTMLRSFLGVPVASGEGKSGCLYVADRKPRDWEEEQVLALRDLARLVESEIGFRSAGRERRSLENLVRTLVKAVENMQLGVTLTDLEGRIVYTNPAEARMHGYTVEELVGASARSLGPPEAVPTLDAQNLRSASSWTRETENVRKDGTRFPVLLWSDLVTDAEGRTIGIVTCSEDITERKRIEEALREQATRDSITGVPNRVCFLERLEAAVERKRRESGTRFGILFLDLDRFKVVNDSLGHHLGDELLAAVAKRLVGCIRPTDTLARFGGDEFAILLEDVLDLAEAVKVAQRIQSALAAPIHLHGHELFTSASVGIVMSCAAAEDAEFLWRSADTAMYRAKARGSGQFEVFDRSVSAVTHSRLQLETDLRKATERGELYLQFQPVVELATGQVAGFESFIRWTHPRLGAIKPSELITLAEETGMIGRIGEWALREACERVVEWQRKDPRTRDVWLAVNLSGKQLSQPDLLDRIGVVLHDTGFPARLLRFEITETGVIENSENALRTLERLKALGAKLFLDDFGTGYASLSYLHTLPLDTLKIDLSFVSRMNRGNRHAQVVQTIVQMARGLNLGVVAEGIANEDQLQLLREFGCPLGQGFLFSPPLGAAEAFALFPRPRR